MIPAVSAGGHGIGGGITGQYFFNMPAVSTGWHGFGGGQIIGGGHGAGATENVRVNVSLNVPADPFTENSSRVIPGLNPEMIVVGELDVENKTGFPATLDHRYPETVPQYEIQVERGMGSCGSARAVSLKLMTTGFCATTQSGRNNISSSTFINDKLFWTIGILAYS